jgi:hypothetical protein
MITKILYFLYFESIKVGLNKFGGFTARALDYLKQFYPRLLYNVPLIRLLITAVINESFH